MLARRGDSPHEPAEHARVEATPVGRGCVTGRREPNDAVAEHALGVEAVAGAIAASIHEMALAVQEYVPGYTLRAEPQFDEPRENWGGHARVTVLLEVKGNGDYLPPFAGNLDIMTAAAAQVGEQMALAKQGAFA